MSFKAKITCDAAGCDNEHELNSIHPSDAEVEIEDFYDTTSRGGWLGYGSQNYCPKHAPAAAEELSIEHAT